MQKRLVISVITLTIVSSFCSNALSQSTTPKRPAKPSPKAMVKSSGITPVLIKSFSQQVNQLLDANGVLFFQGYDDIYGHELWKSDGTEKGTMLVKDVFQGNKYDNLGNFFAFDRTLYFTADDGTKRFGREFWKSDGTAEGTAMVKDTQPGGQYIPNELWHKSNMGQLNNIIFFTSHTDLWKSDGTEQGTILVKKGHGGDNGIIKKVVSMKNALYFHNTYELWRSDGTEARTIEVYKWGKRVPGNITDLIVFHDKLILAADGELWLSDGTIAGTKLLKDIRLGPENSDPQSLTVVGQTLYFAANDGAHGNELWKSDGTEAGTVLVKDIVPGFEGKTIANTAGVNGILYFSFGPENKYSGGETFLYKSDGTENGTVMIRKFGSSTVLREFTVVNGNLFFAVEEGSMGSKYSLYKSDGTETGTIEIKEYQYPGPNELTPIENKLFFVGPTETRQIALWKIDMDSAAITK